MEGGTRPVSQDLSPLMNEWPYEPGKLNVRLIAGDDGEPRIQVRLDLGVIQMFVDGRPDGERPHGYDSLLEYHEARLDETEPQPQAEAADPALPPAPAKPSKRFTLDAEQCQ